MMKQFFILIFALISVLKLAAQSMYETPHVKDGKTFQITIPSGFHIVSDGMFGGDILFCAKEGVHYNDMETVRMTNGILGILHEPKENQSLQMFADELREELIEFSEKKTIFEEPTVIEVNGRNCMFAGFKGEMEGDKTSGVYFGATEFGDYFIVVAYYALEGVVDVMDYSEFKKVISSWKEVATSKEDGMLEYEEMYENERYDELETNFKNDLFDTKISYYDVLPDYGENWNEPLVENSHLLSEFIYKEENGSLQIFSGGLTSNYPTHEEIAETIKLVTDSPTELSVEHDTQFSNEDHMFNLFSITGGGTMTSVYTTIVNNELIFFVVDGGQKPVVDFKPAVRDFMLTMWIDYVPVSTEDK